ncbi:MAG: hypothetical protein H8Z69_05990 [Nanohaloarchaea archaeon]|nr:hypothetical protein [Candidatus Nanohaloarchaea archaeon]
MSHEILSTNEDIRGQITLDQSIEMGEGEIYMSRPYSSVFNCEAGVASLALCEDDDFYEIDDLDPQDPDYGEIYR